MAVTVMFHAGPGRIDGDLRALCVTDHAECAQEYLYGGPGWLHVVEFDSATRIAQESDILDATESLGLTRTADQIAGDWTDFFEAADREDVRAILTGQGYAGAEYLDTSPTGRTHRTILVWDTSVLTLTDTEAIA